MAIEADTDADNERSSGDDDSIYGRQRARDRRRRKRHMQPVAPSSGKLLKRLLPFKFYPQIG